MSPRSSQAVIPLRSLIRYDVTRVRSCAYSKLRPQHRINKHKINTGVERHCLPLHLALIRKEVGCHRARIESHGECCYHQ